MCVHHGEAPPSLSPLTNCLSVRLSVSAAAVSADAEAEMKTEDTKQGDADDAGGTTDEGKQDDNAAKS